MITPHFPYERVKRKTHLRLTAGRKTKCQWGTRYLDPSNTAGCVSVVDLDNLGNHSLWAK